MAAQNPLSMQLTAVNGELGLRLTPVQASPSVANVLSVTVPFSPSTATHRPVVEPVSAGGQSIAAACGPVA
ncbi:MAG: hypothetical protein ACLP01_18560 [Solirubrobacteraceae bacterium]